MTVALTNKPTDLGKRTAFLGLSLLINTTGHALTIVTNLGSAVWTASAVNLYHIIPLSLWETIFLYGVLVMIANMLIVKQFNFRRLVNNLLFIFPFSYLIQLFASWLTPLHLNNLWLPVRIVIDLVGILCVALATSIYQRANLVLHPNDDFMQIIRYHFVHGNAAIAQMIHYIPPVIVMIITFVATGRLYAVNIGTVVCLFFQGNFIGFFDEHVFKQLQHYGIENLVQK